MVYVESLLKLSILEQNFTLTSFTISRKIVWSGESLHQFRFWLIANPPITEPFNCSYKYIGQIYMNDKSIKYPNRIDTYHN